MKRCVGVVLVLFLATPLFAQSHPDVVAAVKADLQARGVDLSGACGAFQITKRVAWRLRDEGAGVLDKPAGNQCEGRAVDIIIYPGGRIFDILTDAGGSNGASWGAGDPVDASRWRPVTSDPDGGVAPPPVVNNPPPVGQPPVINIPPAQVLDLSAVLAAIKDVRDAQERIYADDTNQRTDQTKAIVAAVNEPGWFSQVFGNRYVQMLIAGVGTYVATHQVMK